jgi:hypothetical protein
MEIFWQILIAITGVLLLWGLIVIGIRYRRAKIMAAKSWDLVFLKINIPKKESKEDREIENEQFSSRDFKEMISVMSHFYDALSSIGASKWGRYFGGEDFISLEYAVIEGRINFYIACPSELVSLIEKQLTGFYPDVFLEEVPEYSIFSKGYKQAGAYLKLNKEFAFPIKTYQNLQSDPLNTLTNVLSKLSPDEGAAIQIMIQNAPGGWQHKCKDLATSLDEGGGSGFSFNPLKWIFDFFKLFISSGDDDNSGGDDSPKRKSSIEQEAIKLIEEKSSKVGFEVVCRIITSAKTESVANGHLSNIKSAFAQYSGAEINSFGFSEYHNLRTLISNFVLRRFTKPIYEIFKPNTIILNSEELASIFHLPNIKFNRSPNINWQNYKNAPAPHNIPTEGLLLGHNHYRGETKEIRMKTEDRFRHFYVIGQTGTGKSSILQTMIRQDFRNGNGLCVIDPHGSLIDDILPFVPRERADDVIIFNPGDTERPLGLNLLEASTPEEMDLVALDAMNIMIKLFGNEIFGPRIQDYFRNGCLTLMEQPEGGALTDIVRLFTDDEFQKLKVENVKNPIVRSFWENQMAKTGAREKAEMIPYFAAKFGQFVTNTMMRNIIGQTKSAFDFSQVMQEGKILLMNLSKGATGDINSKLLGLIIVSKIQMAALRRQKVDKEDRRDFFLYIDEFQNYITDSIESILSEARKYRLGLVIAHQYIKQLEGDKDGSTKIRDAVFGNVGTMMCYKIGAQDAEYMAKEMAPVFSDQDLINVDKFKAVMKLSIDTQPSRPFSIVPKNPYLETGDKEAAEAFTQLARLKYGRDKDFVEREILRRVGAI